MATIFAQSDYRKFLQEKFRELPREGYGQAQRLAQTLGVHSTLVSQILSGKKSFTLEQAAATCDFLALDDLESEYFLLLVQLDRAGTQPLKRRLQQQLERLREKGKVFANRFSSRKELSDADRAIFYSDWIYSGIRLLSGIGGFHKLDPIADYFGLSRRRTKDVIDFLLKTGLCKEAGGEIRMGPQSTHLKPDTPWARLHHVNWRQRAIELLNSESHAKLHYTAPVTLSRKDADRIRGLIVKFLEEVDAIVEPSREEELYCLNVDWFEVRK